jgi:hypothetical protein
MYSFIYYFIYSGVKEKNPDSKFYSSGGVVFMQGIHAFFIISILQYFELVTVPRLHEEYLPNKWLFFPIGIAWLLIVNWYFSRKSKVICEKYDAIYKRKPGYKKLYSANNILLFANLYIVPLVIGIWILNLGR